MQIYEYGKDILPMGGCALAIGVFDGVHLAHRALIYKAAEEAATLSLPVGVFTFSPKSGIKPESACIYTLEQRLSIIESLGVDFCVVANFEDIRGLDAVDFCHDVLYKSLNCKICVVGYNFRFGRGATADADALKDIMSGYAAKTVICPQVKILGESVSSTAIRHYLISGDTARAGAMLGDDYYIEGYVRHGRGVGGSRLGAPTANLSHPEGTIIPHLGVYAARVEIDGKSYPAAVNLGVCPTFEERAPHSEAYIIGYSGDLYGKKIKLSFVSFLRDERCFDSEEELRLQIEVDKNTVIKEFERTK